VSQASQNPLEIVIVGHVDHGKSTLVGRLFFETGSMPDGKVEAIEAMCKRRGVPFEWAFLMDALRAERDQNITIDTSHIWFKTEKRPYVIIDAPGHREFLKNMITGAASASAALLLIAADEGVQEQSRRHGYMLSLLGIRQVAVVVNKMDLVDFSERRFREIEAEYRLFLKEIGLEPLVFIPISARGGENIVESSKSLGWFDGPTVVDVLDSFAPPLASSETALRFPVQDVYRFDNRRIVAGRIETGTLKVGDEIVFYPTGRSSKVASIEGWGSQGVAEANPGGSVGITLEDQLFVERGHVAVRKGDRAPGLARRVTANVFWLGKKPLRMGSVLKIKLATQELSCRVAQIAGVLDASTLEVRNGVDFLDRDDVATVVLETDRPLVVDLQADFVATGRFVLVDGYEVSGGGIVVGFDEKSVQIATQILDAETRWRILGQKGLVVSLQGTEIERNAVERLLLESGTRACASALENAAALRDAGVVALVQGEAELSFDLSELGALDVVAAIRLAARLSQAPGH